MTLRKAVVSRGCCDICGQANASECEFCELFLCENCTRRHVPHCSFGKLQAVTPTPAAAPIRVGPVLAGAKKEVA